MTKTAQVLAEIGDERQRQIAEEGWTPDHDDGHSKGELANAAACYAAEAGRPPLPPQHRALSPDAPPNRWPWSRHWWKPGPTKRRMLVKAAALLVAEIERLDRKGGA